MNTVTKTVPIIGMTCGHCEIAVERALCALPGVHSVKVNHVQGRAEIIAEREFPDSLIAQALELEGYSVGTSETSSFRSRLTDAGAALIIVIAAGLILSHFNLVPAGLTVSDQMTFGLVFVIGLVASVSTCMAVTGGLLVALAAKYNELSSGRTAAQRFLPHLYFNAGRLLSYAFFGALIGGLGALLALTPTLSGILTVAVSIIMLVLGVHMLGLFPAFRSFSIIPKGLTHRIHNLVDGHAKGSAFVVGAASFFLPCGFTLALQLYVLSTADAATGALVMFVFALGTLPALLSLSALSAFATGALQSRFVKIAGAAVIVLAVMNIQFGLVQMSMDTNASAGQQYTANQPSSDTEAQVVEMKIVGLDYIPNRFTVKRAVPVEWRIDAREAAGCGRVLIAPKIGLTKLLSAREPTILRFTPQETQEIAFNCGMGMMTPASGFTVVN